MKVLLVVSIVLSFVWGLVALLLIIGSQSSEDEEEEFINFIYERVNDPEEVKKILAEYHAKDIIQ